MEIYFDNSATTRCSKSVAELMVKVMTEDYGNPSSMHKKGVEAEQYVKAAKEQFARILKCSEKEIFFTSGGTESNNMALIGVAEANRRRGMHLITSSIEHPSVLNTMKYLETQGFQVTYLPVDKNGIIDTEALCDAITEETTLVSVMHVNNEIGSVQPLEKIGELIKKKNPNTYFHVDSVQGFGKYRIHCKKMKIDLLSVSGHKIHGPKGVGVLYVNEKVKIVPVVYGGGQQKGMRSGTENVPGIAGIGEAARLCYQNFDEKIAHMYEVKNYFTEKVLKLSDTGINGPMGEEGAPHIVSVNFAGVRSEVLLHALEEKGIYVSAGSACASNKAEKSVSDTLKNIKLPKELWENTIRFSFCEASTKEEVDICMRALEDMLDRLRKFTRY